MGKIRNSMTRLVAMAFVALMLAAGCSSQTVNGPSQASDSAQASDPSAVNGSAAIVFTDVAGREVRLDKPPETFIVANYIANFMMVGGAESLDKVVGMTFDGWEDTRYGEYKVFTDAFPRMKSGDIVSIGGYHDDVLNAEKIVSLEPDVLLMNLSQYAENNPQIATFEQAGIAVVVLDYHAQKLENHTKSTEILGLLLGREQVAKEQNEAYIGAIEQVNERIAALPEEQKGKKVYVELGNKGVSEYGNSYSDSMLWGAIVHNVGADNMGAGIDGGYGVLDKEFVIASNPDVIFIGGSIWSDDSGGDQMRMGFAVDEATAQERLAGFASRPEWKDLKAVKNGEVYGVDHGSLRNMIDYAFTQYLAKALYPEAFADIDPAKSMHDYYEKYLPELNDDGTFMIRLR